MNDLVSTKDFFVILINNLIYTEFLLGIVNPWSWPRQSIITEQGTKESPSFIPCSIPQGRTMRVPSRPPPRSRPRRRESWGLNPQPPLHWVSLLDAVRVCVPSENVREYVIDWPKRNVRKSFWNPIAVLGIYWALSFQSKRSNCKLAQNVFKYQSITWQTLQEISRILSYLSKLEKVLTSWQKSWNFSFRGQ